MPLRHGIGYFPFVAGYQTASLIVFRRSPFVERLLRRIDTPLPVGIEP